MDYLSVEYPSLYIHMLGSLDKPDKIEQYMAKCKEYEDHRGKFSLYIHGYFLPWLDQQRKAGKLKKGRCVSNMLIDSNSLRYEDDV